MMNEEILVKEQKQNGICRVCLISAENKGLSLFEKFKDHFVYTYIHLITNVQIHPNDGYPDQICKNCILDLETAIQFKEKCEASNRILQELTSESTPDVKDLNIKEENFTTELKRDDSEDDLSTKTLHDVLIEDLVEDNSFLDTETVPLDDIIHENGLEGVEFTQYQCHDCGGNFRSKCKLRVHWKKTHYDQSRLKVCNRCKLSFKTLHAYQNHIKNETKRCKALGDENIRIEGLGKNRVFHCRDCGYNTTTLPNIIHHCAKHSGKGQYQCDLCLKVFIQYASWSAHREYTHKQFKQILPCHYCGKIIKGSGSFKRHIKTHNKEKNYECEICRKKYKTKCTLRNHMNLHNDKKFTCEICAKVFSTSSGLWIHIQYVHKKHNRQLFKCGICEYKTLKLYNVKKHEQKHTDRNIACPQCGKFFDKAEKMLKHQRVHFDEKKFACTECDRKYLRLDSLHKHQKFAHGMQFS